MTSGKTLPQMISRLKAMNSNILLYEKAMIRIAEDSEARIADSGKLVREAIIQGSIIHDEDGTHLNFEGEKLLARAVLNSLGYSDIAIPKKLKPKLFPGVIRKWRMRYAPVDPDGNPILLTEKSFKNLSVDSSWRKYRLPDPLDEPNPWNMFEHRKRNGFAYEFDDMLGFGFLVQAYAEVTAEYTQIMYVNTEPGILTLWINGKKIKLSDDLKLDVTPGWDRIPVELNAGAKRYNRNLYMKGTSVSYVGSSHLTGTRRGPKGYAHEEDYRKSGRRSNDFENGDGPGSFDPGRRAEDAPIRIGS